MQEETKESHNVCLQCGKSQKKRVITGVKVVGYKTLWVHKACYELYNLKTHLKKILRDTIKSESSEEQTKSLARRLGLILEPTGIWYTEIKIEINMDPGPELSEEEVRQQYSGTGTRMATKQEMAEQRSLNSQSFEHMLEFGNKSHRPREEMVGHAQEALKEESKEEPINFLDYVGSMTYEPQYPPSRYDIYRTKYEFVELIKTSQEEAWKFTSQGMVWDKDIGAYLYEILPSNRTEAFLKATRFTLEEAWTEAPKVIEYMEKLEAWK